MKTAVLCPGPSLPRTWKGRGGYERVLGVNRAAHFDACDEWVFADATHPRRLPLRWFTIRDARHNLGRAGRIPPNAEVQIAEDFFPRAPQQLAAGQAWTAFSTPLGVMAAYFGGATSIDLYGHDMAIDRPDYDGVDTPGNNRGKRRFEHETLVMSAVIAWLAERGCEVKVKHEPD